MFTWSISRGDFQDSPRGPFGPKVSTSWLPHVGRHYSAEKRRHLVRQIVRSRSDHEGRRRLLRSDG